MSNALAIASVTAILRDLLNNGLIDHNVSSAVGNVTVTAKPPDRVLSDANGSEAPQLNLFLHQITPNLGWRNAAMPSLDSGGRRRISNQPLALDLHYLISAYGAEDLHTDILIGYAMQLLHETPVLTRGAIRKALIPSPSVATGLPPALQKLAESGLADQIEQIKIAPDYMSTEDMSKLWTAVQSHYRPSAAYLVTVVLIESTLPTIRPLPVLKRGSNDEGVFVHPHLVPPVPTITRIEFPQNQLSARMGDTIRIQGVHLSGSTVRAVFTSARLTDPLPVDAVAGTDTDTEVAFVMPTVAADWAAGLYTVQISVVRPSETDARMTNPLPFYLAPVMILPATVTHPNAETTHLALSVAPVIRKTQYVLLTIGDQTASADPRTVDTADLEFNFNRIPAGQYFSRLIVDGVESWMIIRTSAVPEFDTAQRITVP